MHVDLTVRIRDLVAAVRAAYATSAAGLSTTDCGALARAALGELATLTEPQPRRAFRPIVITDSARPSALGTGVCSPADAMRAIPAPVVSADTEQRVAALLADPQQPRETIEAMFRRKEQALGELFAALAPIEAFALHRRLANPLASDVLATQFSRLVADRRVRLLAFLAGARRREALRSA